MERDRNGQKVLSPDECRLRLGRGGVGRVAVSIGALPAIFPINYATLDGDIVFRTAPGTKLAAAIRNAVIAFEVDDIDRLSHAGWSVMVIGRSHQITDPEELAAADRLPLTRWVRRGEAAMVRVQAELISGRELTADAADGDTQKGAGLALDRCPECGSDAIEAVSDGTQTNFVCTACLACWHVELGWLHRVPPSTCPGCRLTELCRAVHLR